MNVELDYMNLRRIEIRTPVKGPWLAIFEPSACAEIEMRVRVPDPEPRFDSVTWEVEVFARDARFTPERALVPRASSRDERDWILLRRHSIPFAEFRQIDALYYAVKDACARAFELFALYAQAVDAKEAIERLRALDDLGG